MKNVKIDDKSKFMSIVLVMVVLIGVVFFLGYRKFEEKAASLNDDSDNLENRIKDLEMYYLTEEQNKKDTETMIAAIDEIFSKYNADARYEDGIYEAYNLYNGSNGTLDLTSVMFIAPTPVKEIIEEVVDAAGIEKYDTAIDFDRFDVTYEGALTYEGLKGMVREIAGGDYNLVIGQMTYSITPNGYITGTSQLSFYFVTGAGLSYTEPPVQDYETGLENLFGVSQVIVDSEEAEN